MSLYELAPRYQIVPQSMWLLFKTMPDVNNISPCLHLENTGRERDKEMDDGEKTSNESSFLH